MLRHKMTIRISEKLLSLLTEEYIKYSKELEYSNQDLMSFTEFLRHQLYKSLSVK